MGRGIIESGLFRSERYQLERRTSDPATTQEGEMWIRTDIAPDADQLATLRFDNGSGTWDIPIYDTTATTDNVSKALRFEVAGSTGFVPVTTSGGTYDALRLQHNDSTYAFHDALEASAIPDSVIHRYTFEDNSDTTTLTDIAGSADGTITGMTYTSSQADGDYAGDFDGTDDEVSIPATESPPISFTFDYYPRAPGAALSWAQDYANSQGISIKANVNDELEIVYGSTLKVINTSELSINTRQHVGVTVSSSDEITVYLDGSQVGSATSSNNGWGGSSYLGSEGGDAYADGIVDDFDVDDKVLSQSEIQERM
ncbi:LamG-like jellyroll fold domain-containing protein [Halarchaeum salinum]|uniref:LamG domain-containing protein n=1 Tax=Halarchaeum salinum TaxID=489912 RepID=A0AAV3S7U1_9EURY